MDIKKLLANAGRNISETLNEIDPSQIDALADALAKANRVFTSGWGRAGNVIRILGMDMSQLGKIVYCVGDNSTPSIHEGDILVVGSGSGNTKTISLIAQQAKEYGATLALISGAPAGDSIIGKIADINVTVPRIQRVGGDIFKNHPKTKNKGLGERYDLGLSDEMRETIAYETVTGYYETAFALNSVIKQLVMNKIGGKMEDTSFYHNNLE